ncbi:MAG: sigma-70 family RNA polymerase sigma factor [Pseudomonadota bacterium]
MTGQANKSLDELAPGELVARIQNDDQQAEAALIRRYSRSLMTMLKQRTGGDVQRSEDVHQNTFLIVLKRLRSPDQPLQDPGRVAAFIHRTAENVLIGEYRKESRRQTYADSETIEQSKDPRSGQLQRLIDSEAQNAVRELVLELSNERDRELLYRFYILQQEKPLICEVLSLTPVHFDRVISRARSRFRKQVEARGLSLVDSGSPA